MWIYTRIDHHIRLTQWHMKCCCFPLEWRSPAQRANSKKVLANGREQLLIWVRIRFAQGCVIQEGNNSTSILLCTLPVLVTLLKFHITAFHSWRRCHKTNECNQFTKASWWNNLNPYFLVKVFFFSLPFSFLSSLRLPHLPPILLYLLPLLFMSFSSFTYFRNMWKHS
jgi:hypothetical protein